VNSRISRTLWALILCALPAIASTTSQPTAIPENLSDTEFQSLVEKTNLYVKALNAVSAAQRTYDRYSSWVDVKKGPTGKERYISYGLYNISKSSVEEVTRAAKKGPQLKPALPELDSVIVRLAESFSALEPLVKKASDYYEQEDYRDDDAQGAKEMHAAMMPLFGKTFAAERELRRALDLVKAQVDRRQLAEIEQTSGRKYEWHLRSFMLAAKALINLLPENTDAPVIGADEYKMRYAELESAYSAFQTFQTENPEEVKKVIMASFVDSAVKDFFTASKFLRRTLEAKKLDRRDYFNRLGELAKSYNDLIQRTNSMR
jgi:hypothetical protein